MRWKLVAGNVIAVLVVGLLAWSLVRGRAAESLTADVDPSVERATQLLEAVRTQDGDQLLVAVRQSAASADAAAIYTSGNQSEQRDAAFRFAEGFARQLQSALPRRGRPPELVAVTGPDGAVLARNVEAGLDFGRSLRGEFPSVAHALSAPQGHAVRDFLKYGEQGWMDVGMAPIVVGGQLKGLLLVGYTLADSAARNDASRLGVDVGFLFREGSAYTVQSLSVGQQNEKEELRRWANEGSTNLAATVARRPRVELALGGETYHAVVMPMPGDFGEQQAAVVVLRSVTDASAPADGVALPILIATLLGVLLVVGYNLYLANYFGKAIEVMEEGLLQVINGNQDYRINYEHSELGGVIYRINQLLAAFSGDEEETDEQGRVSHPAPPPRPTPHAVTAQPVIDEAAIATPPDAATVSALAAEPETAYYERLRTEYEAARAAAGLPADRQSPEAFVEMVRSVEQSLAQQHGCASVRFQVQGRNGQVIFRPVPIR